MLATGLSAVHGKPGTPIPTRAARYPAEQQPSALYLRVHRDGGGRVHLHLASVDAGRWTSVLLGDSDRPPRAQFDARGQAERLGAERAGGRQPSPAATDLVLLGTAAIRAEQRPRTALLDPIYTGKFRSMMGGSRRERYLLQEGAAPLLLPLLESEQRCPGSGRGTDGCHGSTLMLSGTATSK